MHCPNKCTSAVAKPAVQMKMPPPPAEAGEWGVTDRIKIVLGKLLMQNSHSPRGVQCPNRTKRCCPCIHIRHTKYQYLPEDPPTEVWLQSVDFDRRLVVRRRKQAQDPSFTGASLMTGKISTMGNSICFCVMQ